MAVAFAVWVAGGVSGAHINPAVTLAFAVRRKFAWAKVLPYMAAQVHRRVRRRRAGLPRVLQRDRRVQPPQQDAEERRPGPRDVLDLRHVPRRVLPRRLRRAADRPGGRHGVPADLRRRAHRPTEHRRRVQPGAARIGLVVAAIGMSYGPNAGYAINPARDFGPRLFAFFAGWGQVALPGTYSIRRPQLHRLLLDTDRGAADRGRHRGPPLRPFIGDILHGRLKMAEAVEGPSRKRSRSLDRRSRGPGSPTVDPAVVPRDERERVNDPRDTRTDQQASA